MRSEGKAPRMTESLKDAVLINSLAYLSCNFHGHCILIASVYVAYNSRVVRLSCNFVLMIVEGKSIPCTILKSSEDIWT